MRPLNIASERPPATQRMRCSDAQSGARCCTCELASERGIPQRERAVSPSLVSRAAVVRSRARVHRPRRTLSEPPAECRSKFATRRHQALRRANCNSRQRRPKPLPCRSVWPHSRCTSRSDVQEPSPPRARATGGRARVSAPTDDVRRGGVAAHLCHTVGQVATEVDVAREREVRL